MSASEVLPTPVALAEAVQEEIVTPKSVEEAAKTTIPSEGTEESPARHSTSPDSSASKAEPSSPSKIDQSHLSAPKEPNQPLAGPSSPAPRRPKPPTKGILKPAPPPVKPTLGNRLRDLASTVVGGRAIYEDDSSGRTSPLPPNSVGGTLNAIGGRIGLGLSRFVAAGVSPTPSPGASPAAVKVGLPDVSAPGGSIAGQPSVSEKVRQKQPLKRATFVLPSLSITYPISTQGEPWSQKITEERRKIDSTYRSLLSTTTGVDYWTAQRLAALYENACRIREERPRVALMRAFEIMPQPPRTRHIHLSLKPFDPNSPMAQSSTPYSTDIPLNRHAAEALADVLSAEWSLSELKLEGGVLESEDALKPILHALLISGTLPSLSLSGNRKLRSNAWRLLAVFLKRARSLRYIDLSDTNWDKKSVEYLVQALTCSAIRSPTTATDPNVPSGKDQPPDTSDERTEDKEVYEDKDPEDSFGSFLPPAPLLKDDEQSSVPAAIQTLRMDGCGLRAAGLELLAQGVRASDIKNISLRRNRIGPLGAVALAVMIRDYPDTSSTTPTFNPPSSAGTPVFHHPSLPSLDSSPSSVYTPYIPRSRRPIQIQKSLSEDADEKNLPAIPLVVSSSAGVTSRTLPEGYKPPPPPKNPLQMPSSGNSFLHESALFGPSSGINSTPVEGKLFSEGGASIALQRSVRALDGVERIGRLLTLDLKGNEIKTGVGYIAQVLKRNRTLKVLNLSDNRIEASGLVAIAEALKYNSTLETLDMSLNPCCSPNLEGISSLRTTFTVNTSLKRLFLSETGLTSEGAIALAEFLPETKSLLHLDLTGNPLDTAGILAISSGLKANKLIRCLDVSIPPNNPDLAELSQSILQSCIRNTELAASSAATGKAATQDAIWGPIKKSTLVKQVKDAEQARATKQRVDIAQSPEGLAREFAYTLKPDQIPLVANAVAKDLKKWYDAALYARKPGFSAWEPGQLPKEEFGILVLRAKALRERLVERVQDSTTTDDEMLAKLLSLNDDLTALIDQSVNFRPPPRLLLPSQIVPPGNTSDGRPGPSNSHNQLNGKHQNHLQERQPPSARYSARRHMRTTSLEISSPNFSIGDSDGDSDAEELDVGNISSSSTSGIQVQATPPKGLGFGVGLGMGDYSGDDNSAIEHLHSPVERASRAWVEEEGEIFRKGTKLGVVADEEDVDENQDVSGEELRQEILETEVARSPTRRVIPVEEDEQDRQGDGDNDKKDDLD